MTDDPDAARRLAALEEFVNRGRTAQEAVDELTGPDQFTRSSTSSVSKQVARIVVEIATARAARSWNSTPTATRNFKFLYELQTLAGDRNVLSRQDLIHAAAMLLAEIEQRDEIAARKDKL
jgi:hypothetical protein